MGMGRCAEKMGRWQGGKDEGKIKIKIKKPFFVPIALMQQHRHNSSNRIR